MIEENIKLLLKRQQIFEFIDREIGREVLSAEGSITKWRLYQGYIVMLKMCYMLEPLLSATVIISFDDHGFPPPRYYWPHRLTNRNTVG